MDDPPRLVRRSSQTSQISQASEKSAGGSSKHSAPNSLQTINKDNIKLECWIYDDIPSAGISCKEGNIDNSEIAPWLSSHAPPSSLGKKAPAAGLRLVCREHKMSTGKSFDEATLREIHQIMGIPSTHTYLMTHGAGQCGKYMVDSHQLLYIFHRTNSHSTVSAVLKHNSESNITVGYILFGPAVSMDSIKKAVMSQYPSFSLPLLIPILIAEVTAETIMEKLSAIHTELALIEGKTGFGDWGSKPDENVSHRDYRKLAGNLGALESRFDFLDSAVGCTVMTTQFTIQEIRSMKSYMPSAKFRQMKDNISSLNDRAEMLLSNLKHMQIFGGLSQRIRAQQNVIFSLIAQQDNLLNAGIARDSKELAAASKRDSSAMKIIAFLTTLFLPGTFVAAFFSMPLFDWTVASMRGVTTKHFWMYWAVTIPLTIVVMGFMGAYAFHQYEQRKKERKDSQEGSKMTIV